MSYTALKWHKFKFVLHPSEFEAVFDGLDYFIAITNQRVDLDYEINDKTSIFDRYRLYYSKVISGTKWEKKDLKLDCYTQLTNHPDLIKYEVFEVEENKQTKQFKRAIQLEPVINVSPFSLQVDYKAQLRVNLFDGAKNNLLGLEFSYPKEILRDDEIIKTDHLSTFALFKELVKRIKKVSKKVTATRNGVNSNPDFWISNTAISEVNNNFGIKEDGITLN